MNNTEAVCAFLDRKAAFDAILLALSAASADHFETSPDRCNWSDAESLAHAVLRIREVADFLNVKAED